MTEVPDWVTAGRHGHTFHPGGMTEQALRRVLARKAGLASGVARRRRSHAARSTAHPDQPHIRLVYTPRPPSRAEFEAGFADNFPEPVSPQGAAQWRRGLETLWLHAQSVWWKVEHDGQYATTSKPRRAIALEKRGLTRSTRTIRRLNIMLEQLGYCALIHVPTPTGQKDYLRIEWRLHRARLDRRRSFDVTHTSGTGDPSTKGSPAVPSTPQKPLIPPPSAADWQGPAPPAESRKEERGPPETPRQILERQLEFVQLKINIGLGSPTRLALNKAHLRQQLRQLGDDP